MATLERPHGPASADLLQQLVAKVADPLASDIDARIKAAGEIREFLDTPRETESFHALGPLIPPILTLLQSHPINSERNSKDFLFRRALVEIINHLPFHEQVRPQTEAIFDCMIRVLRTDNEENGVICCKTLVDLIRNYRMATQQNMKDFFALFRDSCTNMPAMVTAVLSQNSPLVDPEAVLPCSRSFKGMVEMGAVMSSFMQMQRTATPPEILKPAFDVVCLQSAAQQAARENHEAMGQFWSGMSPDVQNAMAYSDFLAAQAKILSYLTYVMRWGVESQEAYGDTLLLSTLRLLQDCPVNAIGTRKELIVVFRHLMGSAHRRAIHPQIDKLFEERVLLGTGVTGREMFRSPIYSALADFFHHTRNELTLSQLTNVILVYTRIMHNPALPTSVHPMCAKIIISLIDTIVSKDKAPATKILLYILDTCLDRLDALNVMLEEAYAALERAKNNKKNESYDAAFIEKARPLGGAAYMLEEPEDVIHNSRNLFKTLLHGFRSCLAALKKAGEVVVDGSRMNRLFVASVRTMSLLEPTTEDPTEWFALVLVELNLHVFQEIWTHNMEFFFECAQKRPLLLGLCQAILVKDPFSPTLLAIVLRFLVDRLPLLGEYDEATAGATIRLFKMAFNSVTTHQNTNEAILASHLPKLLMDCFPLAAKATKPTHYLFLLRSLFRAIGGGGGRFEILYKEVLPLLPEMLESLNVQLLASEGQTRDLIVELCLTVPLRLTHLLPHLTYLMQPLALALRGGTELVAQGLRTLELCIDNLTPDFLDPTLSTVLRELMEALHSHLKPLPASHQLAHTIIRILGKLGGRNRRLLALEPALKFRDRSEAAKVSISFAGNQEKIEIGPTVNLACRVLKKGHTSDRLHAYNFLESCLSTMLNEGVVGRNVELTFVSTLEGLFDVLNLTEPIGLADRAEEYLLKLSQCIVDMEVRRGQARPSPLLNVFLDALPHALSRERLEHAQKAQSVVRALIQHLVNLNAQSTAGPSPVPDIMMILHQIANRFSSLCLDDAWVRKRAGYSGIRIMTSTAGLGTKWVTDREGDLVRTLIRILKDLPAGLTRDVEEVVDILLSVLRISNSGLDFSEPNNQPLHNKLINLGGLFCTELQSPNPVVRQASQTCIALLVELSGRSAYGLLEQHRDRLLGGIYTKPLRALPFPIQIGMIEAVRYCITLDPPLVEYNEELLRLLHETLALADAEDSSLLPRGSLPARQGGLEIIKLRVACIKLLTASMPLTDFFSRQHQTRQRVTGVYFKSLYSPSPEVKDVAYDGLKMVLTHQSRLPRELLQTGLRPILMNLADPKRLSVPGLEGLARLLELLTNYFKVEIGHKLLDHFRIVADPLLLSSASKSLVENEGITKLVRLANIFHLLPSAANIFLESLVNQIVQTESQMHFSGRTPFSEPLAKYLDRYPVEGIDFFLRQLAFPSHLRTLRSILQAKLAPNLQRELASRTSSLVSLLRGEDASQILPSLSLISDLVEFSPSWVSENGYVIDALLELWHSESSPPDHSAEIAPQVIERHNVILSIFKTVLGTSFRIDLVFEIVNIYTRNLGMDLVRTTRFLYQHVALSDNVLFQRNVLMRFLVWFDDPSITWGHKMFFIRYVVTPTVLVQAHKPETRDQLLDTGFLNRLSRLIWHPTPDPSADDLFKIELLHLTTVLVQQYPKLLDDAKKDIIRCAWQYISNEDTIVKQTGFLLTARFLVAFPSPPRFVLKTWHGLLRTPSAEGRPLVRSEALATLVPCLSGSDTADARYPQWAWTARNLLVEEGLSQSLTIYQLIVKHPALFYPVRGLFVSHMINSLSKLGMSSSSTPDSRSLSIEILNVIFKWEETTAEALAAGNGGGNDSWITPLTYRENLVSYLVRLATYVDPVVRNNSLAPKTLALLQKMVGPHGWKDVAFGLRFFQKHLEQNELTSEPLIAQALASAKVLQVIAAEQDDNWYIANAEMLQKLVRKGMVTEEYPLHDALHPIFSRLVRLFPLPKEDDEQQDDRSDFHAFIHSAISDGFRDTRALRGVLLMLKSVVQVSPERIEPYAASLLRLLGRLAKEHVNSAPASTGFENSVRLVIAILDICQLSVASLADQRRWLLSTLVVLVEKSKSSLICNYTLDLAKSWALVKQDAYPTMKEKASLLQKMVAFESRTETIYHSYLEVIYQIYTEPHLRRSDLTSRLEHSFLLGCRAKDPELREKFMDLLDASVPRSLISRFTYIFGVQSWEALADHNWIYLALHLVLDASDATGVSSQHLPAPYDRRAIASSIPRPTTQSVLQPMQRLLFLDIQAAHDTWISVFSAAWASLSRREQTDLTQHMINLLSRDYHIKQCDLRPNIIQTLLTGIHASSPPMILPPHLVKYLGKTFGAWYVALEILGSSLDHVKDDEHTVREYILDSLADVYAELAEDDMFYGLWRHRCLHLDTNIALAFEQNGMWEQASNAYEVAQSKARAGTIPFSEGEFCLWEDHWILAAEKLQQWDILQDLAKSEGNQELMLECAWRTTQWVDQRDSLEEQINQLPEVPTPRRRVFEAFIALLKLPAALDKNVEFTKILEDAMQLSLRKWIAFPTHFSAAHVPLLQHFQQFVELQEAVQIFGSLSTTNAQNLEKKSSDLKMVLQAWRERLPNLQDDISIWSDLVAWRQNVFHAINNAYIPLITNNNQGGGAANNTQTFGYRGYHETAWIINRFAHVARKHDLLDACFTSLTKIYTLPNIEISEAFLKLREQARCHYQKPNDLQAGLEVINNTNLVFFSVSQKAEFYTLKGMFHARFKRNEEANLAFGQAVQLDMTQAKAWAEWGRFNDNMFKEVPNDLSYAANAVSCYLQAAGQYKSAKSRPLIARIQWLLSVDDSSLAIARAFDTYKGDAAYWYWISSIPHLCMSLYTREVKQARYVLLSLARHYPQALFFQLRTTREEVMQRKAAMARAQAASADASRLPDGSVVSASPATANADHPMPAATDETHNTRPAAASVNPGAHAATETGAYPRQAWDYVEEVVQLLKTAFPLLVLSLETIVDQVAGKFKSSSEEDTYRHLCMLLSDALQNYVLRTNSPNDDGQVNQQTMATLARFGTTLNGQVKKDFDEAFGPRQTVYDYIQKLQQWRTRYEKNIDARPRVQPLDTLSHYLSEFQYMKVDEIEVPGQYTEDKDSNQNFIRIQKFGPKFENCRTHGFTWKRIVIHGTDNSKTSFSIQVNVTRNSRREERVMQIFRTFNGALTRKPQSRKRNLSFHIPAVISLSPSLRLLQTDSSYVSLGDVYDLHCEESSFAKEDPVLFAGEKIKKVLKEYFQQTGSQPGKSEYLTLKKDIYDEVALKMVPEDILTRYMIRTMDGPSELWRMRKQFALQVASCSFMTYMLSLTHRTPQRYIFSRTTGQMTMTEMVPGISQTFPVFATNDVVPFRLTPNIQHFLGRITTEGILTSGIMAIGRSLTEPEFDLEQQLCLFSRDEVMTWLRARPTNAGDAGIRKFVIANTDQIVKRAETMACKVEREQAVQNPTAPVLAPVVQTVTNLISSATNPIQLTKMGEMYTPWF